MIVENIGDVILRGHRGVGSKISGKVHFLLSPEDWDPEQIKDKLLVISHCDELFISAIKLAKGVILQNCIGDTASEKYAITLAKPFKYSANGPCKRSHRGS